jgi:hypothetical protein
MKASKNKINKKITILVITSLISSYLVWSFILNQFNILNWERLERGFYVIFAILTMIIMYSVYSIMKSIWK